MIFGFYTNTESLEVNDYMTKLKTIINKEPENYTDIAKNPYVNSYIIKIENNYILNLNMLYGGINPILFIIEKIILNKYLLIYKIRSECKKRGNKQKIKLLPNHKIIELLICNQKIS